MNPTTSQKRTLKRFLAAAWPKINAAGGSIVSTKETHRNYFAWCRRHKFNPEDKRCFATYFGLFSESRDRKIRTRPLSLALFEQQCGVSRLLLSDDAPRDFWDLSLTAQVIEWNRLERDDAAFTQRLREGRENAHDYFPTRRCKVSVTTKIVLPENTPHHPFLPQDRYRVKWKFSTRYHRRTSSRNGIDVVIRPDAFATLDSVFTDVLVTLFGYDFIPQKGREIRTTIQPYRYRTKKHINKCIDAEQKRRKYRSTEPHY